MAGVFIHTAQPCPGRHCYHYFTASVTKAVSAYNENPNPEFSHVSHVHNEDRMFWGILWKDIFNMKNTKLL